MMVTVALRAPAAAGVKVTGMLQLPPMATLVPQLLVWAKSPGFVPVMAMLVMESAADPGLLKVTVCAALAEPMFWAAKVRLVAVREATGAPAAWPVPESVAV